MSKQLIRPQPRKTIFRNPLPGFIYCQQNFQAVREALDAHISYSLAGLQVAVVDTIGNPAYKAIFKSNVYGANIRKVLGLLSFLPPRGGNMARTNIHVHFNLRRGFERCIPASRVMAVMYGGSRGYVADRAVCVNLPTIF